MLSDCIYLAKPSQMILVKLFAYCLINTLDQWMICKCMFTEYRGSWQLIDITGMSSDYNILCHFWTFSSIWAILSNICVGY